MNEEEYDDITSFIKEKVATEYNNKIKKVMIIEQKKYMERLKMRKDQVQVMSLINLESELPELKVSEAQYLKAIDKPLIDSNMVASRVREEFENAFAYTKSKQALAKYTSHVSTLIDLYDFTCQRNKKYAKKLQKAKK